MLAADLIARAVHAPSSHNTQPWWFRVEERRIELHADRTRALPVNDPFDRELTLSCGAALRTLEVAAAAAGCGTRTELLPPGDDPDHLATVTLGGERDDAAARAAEGIDRRRTTRESFGPGAVDPSRVSAWTAVVEAASGCGLVTVDRGPRREAVAALVDEGDRAQFADPRWRRELASWMHPRRRGDGLTVPGLLAPLTRAAVRAIDLGRSTAGADRRLALEAPWLGVLTTASDDERAWLEAGRALQSMLLTAAVDGHLAGYLNQPCQVPELRPRLAETLGIASFPQLVLRLGRGTADGPPSPRRPVADVLRTGSGTPGG